MYSPQWAEELRLDRTEQANPEGVSSKMSRNKSANTSVSPFPSVDSELKVPDNAAAPAGRRQSSAPPQQQQLQVIFHAIVL